MAAVVTTNGARLGIVWALAGVEYAVNVLHYDVGNLGTITQAHCDDAANEVQSAFEAAGSWQDVCASTVSLARVTLRDLRTLNRPEFSSTVGSNGVDNNNILPLAASLVVTLRTQLAGRSYRGRIYLPGATELHNTSNGTATQAAADAANLFATLIDALTLQGTEVVLAVRSGYHTVNGVPNVQRNPAIVTPVTSHVVRDLVWDTQRRRAYAGI